MADAFDIIIRGGRVMDPETGFDQTCDVAIKDGTIAKIGTIDGNSSHEIDATGLIVAPGFLDIHAHGQSVAADRMQAFDGVTTSLELEVGALPVAGWYDRQAEIPRALNYGTAAAWIFGRKAVLGAIELDASIHPIDQMGAGADDMRWSTETADPQQTKAIVDHVRQGLNEGAIGIGLPNGYAPGAGVKEMSEICDLAFEYGTPTFTHIAYLSNIDPQSSVDSYVRLIGLAGATGAHMHICHLNSTSLMDIERVTELVAKAQEQGLPVTTEAYPYGTGATVVSAGFFVDPDFTKRTGSEYSNVELVHNHHRFTGREDIERAREASPTDLVMWHYLDVEVNEEHRQLLDMSVTFPAGSIASDAMPWVNADGSIYEGLDWPLPDGLSAHPRSSGTFTRFLREYVRERGVMTLMEGLKKCTILPARVIEGCAPQIAQKVRVQEGCDADLVIFDMDTLTDRADFVEMNRPSEGVRYLLVNGVAVIADGQLETSAAPGRPIRRSAA
ncbi:MULTISPECIES: amidohydrolase family protein [unclassified Sulfitobacter]|uniref:amidohydrolase family protein n=1 Tax=unclassified Sulfitobacter TaxID=196795 RepID=UPI0007C357FD|nr:MULTISPECIES: amidohydrolase family protein [unclassified Sulfitobacter]KZX98840.1 D-glutamate deacylase [Sulfitobacter sp. HI0021]KZY01835.1 D-glutamate deacylase [Sulfitobacter sp. HI0027]KZZ03209.1 D-glutamate deacylase [Sulfitobacter sp. HI0076]